MNAERTELTKAEVERLFVGAVDDAHPDADAIRLREGLDDDSALKARFEKYNKAIQLLKQAPKERAPESLSTVIMRRVRRRRVWGRNAIHTMHMQYRVPVEVILPVLIGVLVAMFVFFSAP